MRVCVPVCAKSFAELAEACERAREWADIIELRLDCIEVGELVFEIERFVSELSRPVILTFRPAEQGGYRALTRSEREAFWTTDLKPIAFCDIESDLVLTSSSLDWPRVIASHHDFSGVPEDLDTIYQQLSATPARIVKIAVRANDITDCLPVFNLLDRARRENRELIAIAMGNAGILTRILGPSRGAFLTYGSLEDESATAPGQVNARQLRSVYRIDEINDETMICGLVGLPVMHSVSPHMHNAAFAAAGLNGVYVPLEVRDVASFVKRMVHPRTRELDWNPRGLSVTAPHKSSIMSYLDSVDPEAKEIGAVNTVVVEDDKLVGYNTDAEGLLDPLRKIVPTLRGLRVAVIGAGGAARTAVWAMKLHEARVTVFARNLETARPLARLFELPLESLRQALFRDYDLVINATPLGSGEFIEQTPAVAEQLAGAGLVYDLIYNPIETKFLKEARRAGCRTLGGLAMLVAQGRLQFELWTEKTPSTHLMYDAAAAALGR